MRGRRGYLGCKLGNRGVRSLVGQGGCLVIRAAKGESGHQGTSSEPRRTQGTSSEPRRTLILISDLRSSLCVPYSSFPVLPPSGPSGEVLLDVKGSLGKLSVPEEPKVSHGDDNLSVDDFLSAAARRAAGN